MIDKPLVGSTGWGAPLNAILDSLETDATTKADTAKTEAIAAAALDSAAQQAELNLKAPLASPAFTGTPTGVTKTHVGLGSVDNTSDVSKPVSTLQAAADATKANIVDVYDKAAADGRYTTTADLTPLLAAKLATTALDTTTAVLVPGPSATATALDGRFGFKGKTADAVLYVSPTGSDSDDGLSPGAALLNLATAVTALPTGGGTVVLSAGTHNTTALPNRSGVTYRGAGREVTKVRIASGSLLAPTAMLSELVFEGIDIATNGGHMFDLGATGSLHYAKFVDCTLTTSAAGSSLVKQAGSGNFQENLWLNCDFNRLAASTVPAFDIVNTAGSANANAWKHCRMNGNNNATAPAWRIEASVNGSYAYDNIWEDVVGEQNAGGLIHLYSANGATFKSVVDWDASVSYAADVIFVGKSATNTSPSTNIIATDAGRRGGTLGAGMFDFNAASTTTRVVLIGVGNHTSTPVVQSPAANTIYLHSSAGFGFRVSTSALFDFYSVNDTLRVSPTYYLGRGLNLQEGVTGYTGYVLHARKFADTGDHMVMDGNGAFQWGSGAGTFDTSLSRPAAGVLRAGQKLTAVGGLGVGNSVAATTPGTVTKKIEIFDSAGASLGFIPVYGSIT